MVCQSKVALLASLCCIFPSAHTALGGEGTVALDSSTVSPEDKAEPFDFLVKNSVALEDMDVEKYQEEMSRVPIPTGAEFVTFVKDLDGKFTTLLGDAATYLKGTDIPPERRVDIKNRIDMASSLVIMWDVDRRNLAEAAIESKAETLLDLLQVTNIWDNARQCYWFKALHGRAGLEREGNLHFEYGKLFLTDWRNNFSLICEFDNGDLAVEIRNKVRKEVSDNDFEEFNKDILRFCAKYDAVKVFQKLKLEPTQLKKHLELMKNYKSTKLLKLYRDAEEKQQYLHLDTFTLPESVEELDTMLENPDDFPRMDWFIRKCCKEGRLDLLKHLRELNPRLIPDEWALSLAVKEKRAGAVEWAHKEKFNLPNGWSKIAVELAASGHDQILESVLNKNCSSEDQSHIAINAINMGLLGAIKRIHQKWPTVFSSQEFANWAATKKYLSVLNWLNETFDLLPEIKPMSGATDDMLDWMKGELEAKGKTMDYSGLFERDWPPININVVKWILKEAPSFNFSSKKKRISEAIRNQKDMIWAYETLGIKPDNMYWAFDAGDLEAIEFAGKMFEYVPTEDDLKAAAEKGHFHIIKWFHKKYPKELSKVAGDLLDRAIRFGHLKIADYLVAADFTIEKGVSPEIKYWIHGDKRLNLLKWIHEHSSTFDMPDADYEVFKAATNGDLNILKWYDENIIAVDPSSILRKIAASHGHPKVNEWLLEKYFKGAQQSGLDEDLQCALKNGHLKVAEMIFEKDRLQDGKKFTIECIKPTNYLAMQWLKVNGRWC